MSRVYVAVKPCGCVSAMRNADIERRDMRELRAQLLQWRNTGQAVRLVETREATARYKPTCEHTDQPDAAIDDLVAIGEGLRR